MNQLQIWNGRQLGEAFALAATLLDARHEFVNALNVFPVPDGDTGTNMAMTMKAAVQAIPAGEHSVSDVGRYLAHGALMGARGNSGVILSQIFRGFASGIQDRDELDGRDLARALHGAQEMAYKAVMRPVEGTMLTVIRGAADRASTTAQRTPSLTTVLRDAIDGAQAALDSTPQLLDILRQAGVVDAGGQGIVFILQGLERYAHGDTAIADESAPALGLGVDMRFLDRVSGLHAEDDYGYCTNFMVFGNDLDFDQARSDLAAMGQSAVIVGDDTMLKVHIHTEHPGQVLDYATKLGSLDQIKIDNMSRQTEVLVAQRATATVSHEATDAEAFQGAIAVVAVAAGDGLADALRSMGAAVVVRGGQTMNPSTEDLLEAINRIPAGQVILLPNNKNIILAANQVANLTDRTVRVVPTTSVPQGLAALAAFNVDQPLDSNVDSMTGALKTVTSLELTKAVRDVELNGVHIANGQTIGLIDNELAAAGDDLASVATALFARAELGSPELVTAFAGTDATDADISALRHALTLAFPETEAEFPDGGQPHYLFVIGVE
ncbi:MAG: DAK2 domain-containing protein [Chloroflexota bacterium]|nr:DAK2 domain-containing protein [Chloroflexota bacterium]